MRRIVFLLAVLAVWLWLFVIAGANAAELRHDEVRLDSAAGPAGGFAWRMQQVDAAGGTGTTISRPDFSMAQWREAVVPGTVLNSLVQAGVYPDPYFGLNNAHERKLIPDLSEAGTNFYTYWFRTEFVLPESFRGREVWLELEGINYRAEVWCNGQRIGDLTGMFQRGLFNVSQVVRADGSNALAILVRPVDVPGGFRQKDKTVRAAGENRNGGDGEIGRNTTMLMAVGWDFTFPDGIRDRNTGIWRPVKLFATGPVVLRHPFVKSQLPLPQLQPAQQTISVEVRNASAQLQSGILVARSKAAGIRIETPVVLQAGETRSVQFQPEDYAALTIKKPRLWWPMNKGEPFLYDLTVEFRQGKTVSDQIQTWFGIREITTNRETPDQSRQFIVNGRRIFLHGSNWIPEAMCRSSRERTEAELRYTKQAGVNFLRLWGGGIAESDDFFDLCDELGILVWTEFWQTGDTQVPRDRELYRTNVTDTILRLRNHPSLAYYVSANERDARSIIPIADLVRELDGTRGYQTGSEVDGIHDGSPYVAENPMFYYEDTGSPRGSRINGLCPEYGCPILPTIDALREMMPEADLWPINQTVWDYLDGGGFHRMTSNYDRAVQQYGASAGIEEYAMKAQAFGGLAWRALWECWNANKFDYGARFSTGLLFWYHNSPNRQVCGRMWDWSLEPTAALYFTQDAHEPLHAQFDFLKDTVAVNNEFPRDFRGRLTARVLNFDMREVWRQTVPVQVGAEAVATNVLRIAFPTNVSRVHFLKLELADAKQRPISDTFYWRSDQAYQRGRSWTGPQFAGFEDLAALPKVRLHSATKWRMEGDEAVCTATVRNDSTSLAFLVWLRLQDQQTAKPVRPAFYDDNFFSLLPGESRTINVRYAANRFGAVRLLVDGWNIERQTHASVLKDKTILPER